MYDNWPGEWTALKSSPGISRFLFARVPILEVDGVTIAESQAIARFLARRHGLYADDVFGSSKDRHDNRHNERYIGKAT
ncbi:putative glutathione S-transferase 7 [Saccoglossus kowalevskii]